MKSCKLQSVECAQLKQRQKKNMMLPRWSLKSNKVKDRNHHKRQRQKTKES